MLKSGSGGFKKNIVIIGFVGSVLGCLYPIWFGPMLNPTHYQKIQKHARKDINQEEIQPGNMKVWSDPFGRKKPDHDI